MNIHGTPVALCIIWRWYDAWNLPNQIITFIIRRQNAMKYNSCHAGQRYIHYGTQAKYNQQQLAFWRHRGQFDPKFQIEGVAPTNHSCF